MNSKKAFTLIEVLTTVVVISIIMTIAMFSVNSTIEKSKKNYLTGIAATLRIDIVNYMIKNRPPLPQYNMQIIPPVDPYTSIRVTDKDPWGNDFEIVYADVTRTDGQLYVNLFFQMKNKGCYALFENSTIVTKIGESCNYTPE